MSTTHIAGPPITVGGRIIQRCSLCGEKMLDNKNVAMPQYADGSAPTFATWPVGELVGRRGNYWTIAPHNDGDPLPDDSCLALVED